MWVVAAIVLGTLAILIATAVLIDRTLHASDWLPVKFATNYGPSRRFVIAMPVVFYLLMLGILALAHHSSAFDMPIAAVIAGAGALFLQHMHWLIARRYFRNKQN